MTSPRHELPLINIEKIKKIENKSNSSKKSIKKNNKEKEIPIIENPKENIFIDNDSSSYDDKPEISNTLLNDLKNNNDIIIIKNDNLIKKKKNDSDPTLPVGNNQINQLQFNEDDIDLNLDFNFSDNLDFQNDKW